MWNRNKGYTSVPLGFSRKLIRASVSVTSRKNCIHSLSEVDITQPRRLIQEHFLRTGEKLSFTGYLVLCFAHVLKDYPEFNSFIRRNRLILLNDTTISVLIERELKGKRLPEPVAIHQADNKSLKTIHKEIREAQNATQGDHGSLSDSSWIRFIPSFLLKPFVKLAEANIRMAKRFGKVAITSVGMYSKQPVWFIPHGTATVLLTIGSISQKVIKHKDSFESREHLCITASFDHAIIDGAPAARFMSQLCETIKKGELLENI